MELDYGACVETQAAPKAHYPDKSSGLGHGCPPNGQYQSDNEPIASNWQYDNLSAIVESHIEDLPAVAQPPPENMAREQFRSCHVMIWPTRLVRE